ncbi:unnamed protein product, partial [Adineta steineri]
MFNKYLLLLVGLVAAIYIPTTNAYGICTCFCCEGSSCEPIPEGEIDIPSCEEGSCLQA